MLTADGLHEDLALDRVDKWCQLVLNHRLHEIDQQVDEILEGFGDVFHWLTAPFRLARS